MELLAQGSSGMSLLAAHGDVLALGVAEHDPYWANVIALLHCDGADNSTAFVDQTGATYSASGSARIRVAQSKFGGASGYFGGATSDFVRRLPSAQATFGAGDFTIEFWLYALSPTAPAEQIILCMRNGVAGSGAAGGGGQLVSLQSGKIGWSNATSWLTSSSTIPSATWTHVEVNRSSGVLRIFINGSNTLTASDSAGYAQNREIRIGSSDGGSPAPYLGYIDDLRITKGVARHTGNFTPPAHAYPDTE